MTAHNSTEQINFGHLWAFFFSGPFTCTRPYHTQQVRLPISICCGSVSQRLSGGGEASARLRISPTAREPPAAERIGGEEGDVVHAGGPADEDAEAGEGPRQARAQVGSRPWKSQCSRYANLSAPSPSLAVPLHLHFSIGRSIRDAVRVRTADC